MELNNSSVVHYINDIPFWSAPMGLKLIEKVKIQQNIKILDIGTGLGFPSLQLAMQIDQNLTVYTIDPWLDGINYTKEKAKYLQVHNLIALKQYAESMSFEDDFFDVVVSNYGINNVQDITKTWSEVVRVTKPGSQILFSMYKQEAYFEFYAILAEVFEVMLLKEELRQLKSRQVATSKRELQIEKAAIRSGLRLVSCDQYQWQWKFASGAAFLNHAWIKEIFFPIWFDLIRPYNQSFFLKLIEDRLDNIVSKKGTFIFNIPYSIYEMEKK